MAADRGSAVAAVVGLRVLLSIY